MEPTQEIELRAELNRTIQVGLLAAIQSAPDAAAANCFARTLIALLDVSAFLSKEARLEILHKMTYVDSARTIATQLSRHDRGDAILQAKADNKPEEFIQALIIPVVIHFSSNN